MTPSELAVRRHLKHLTLENKSRYTLDRREQAIQRLAKALPVPLLDATPDQLYEWRAGLTIKPASVACYLSHIKSFYQWAADERLIDANPMTAVPVPKLPRRLPRPIPEEELMTALNATTSKMWIRQALVLGGWGGLRVGEIAGLRVENLRLHDRPPVVIVSDETAKGRKERAVPLSPFVVKELLAADLPLSGFAFTDSHGRPFTPWFMSRTLNEHLRGSGSASTFHATRHRFATQVAHATHDPQVVQELLGHATLATSAIYMAFSKTAATAAVSALPTPGNPHAEPLQEAS